MFGLFSCVAPSPETVTEESSEDDYEETIVFDSNSSIAGSNSSSSSMCKLHERVPADTAKESNNAMRSERTSAISLSQQELSRVIVMSFDSYGKIKDETRSEINIRPHRSFDHSETTSAKEQKKKSNDKNIKKKSYLERIKQKRQEQREDVDYNDLDSFSETGSCKILKRLKEENQQKTARIITSSSNSVASSITGSSFGGSIVSNISVSSSMRRRNREALRSKQTQIMSMAELAGFSATTKSKKNKKEKSTDNKKSWFKRKVKDSKPKRTNKVADWSVTISAVNSIVDTASAQSKQLSSNDNLVSILRTNNSSITPPQSPNVRFVEGTVFQDPHQTRRKKVPRIRGGQPNYQQRKQRAAKKASTALSVNTDTPLEYEETALSVDNDGYCNAMAPLVHAMVKANMGCYVFR